MVKMALVAGIALTAAGLVAGCWPQESIQERSRRLVGTRTYERRGPAVTIHADAERVRNAAGETLSVTMVLGADGYWARPRREYLTRERLTNTKVLVVNRPWAEIGDSRTATLLSRWIHDGGAVLVLAGGAGPEARHQLGSGRVAVIDPSAFGTREFVDRLLDAMHWLDGDVSSSTVDSTAPQPLPTDQSPGQRR